MVGVLRCLQAEYAPESRDPVQALAPELALGTQMDRPMRRSTEHEYIGVLYARGDRQVKRSAHRAVARRRRKHDGAERAEQLPPDLANGTVDAIRSGTRCGGHA